MSGETVTTLAQLSNEDALHVQQRLDALLARSATDPGFRKRLLTTPRAALAEFSGRDVPDSVDVVFIESRGGATIVLPDPIDPLAELSPEELEAVAGGTTSSCLSIIASCLEIIAWLMN